MDALLLEENNEMIDLSKIDTIIEDKEREIKEKNDDSTKIIEFGLIFSEKSVTLLN